MSPKPWRAVIEALTVRGKRAVSSASAFRDTLILNARTWVRSRNDTLRRSISHSVASVFLRMYRARYVIADLRRRYGSRAALIALVGALVASWFLMMWQRTGLEDYFAEGQRLSDL